MVASKFQLRPLIAFIHDFLAIIIAWWLAYLFRFNFEIPSHFQASLVENLLWIVPLQASFFYLFRLYRGIWRYASIPDLKRIFWAVTLSAVVVPFVLFMLKLPGVVPRAVIVLAPLLLMLIMGEVEYCIDLGKNNAYIALKILNVTRSLSWALGAWQ